MNAPSAWDDAETFVDAIVGWRVWRLCRGPSGPALVAAGAGRGAWPARRALAAGCRRSPSGQGRPPHRSPERACTCGAYASDTLRSLVAPGRPFPPLPVVGTVALWGRVIEHARGWRAEYAYPDRVRLLCGVCLTVGAGEGIPRTVVEGPRRLPGGATELSPFCDEHLRRASAGTRILHDATVVQAQLLSRYAVDLLPFDAIASLFERDPVLGPVPFRPRTDLPTFSPPPVTVPAVPTRPVTQTTPSIRTVSEPVATPQPVAVSTPAPRPSPAIRRIKEVANALVTLIVWLLIAWWGCGSMIVRVETP